MSSRCPTALAVLFALARVSCGASVLRGSRGGQLSVVRSPATDTCVPLSNHGTHSTVEVEVGTPGQAFSVVADTGSNSLIVPSCICRQAGYCSETDRCFTGTNRSSSFTIEGGDSPPGVMVSFGSGVIKAVVAHDTVHVGSLGHHMQDGILLMTAHALRIPGAFEGILGLGPPIPEEELRPGNSSGGEGEEDGTMPMEQIGKMLKDMMDKAGIDAEDIIGALGGAMGGAADGAIDGAMDSATDGAMDDAMDNGMLGGIPNLFAQSRVHRRLGRNDTKVSQGSSQVTGFLEQAKIEHFSICFNDGSDGVLRVGTPEPQGRKFTSVGTQHWGVDFRGITVGNMSAPLAFCQGTNMSEHQQTPCGAIPDSGTTAIMAPKEHAYMLYETICDNWQRCADNFTALQRAGEAAHKAAVDSYGTDPFEISVSNASKAEVMKMLLYDCEDWMDEAQGFDELPKLSFHVVDNTGANQTLEIPGLSYVLQSKLADLGYMAEGANVSVENMTGHRKQVCSPAIGEFAYDTKQNGPVWILGTPFFYEYNVGYNMLKKTISFTSTKVEPCGSCSEQIGMVSTGRTAAKLRRPRMARWPWRTPSIDVNRPL